MALTTLLSLAVMGCALVLIFQSLEEKGAQYLAILALTLGALALAVQEDWIPMPSRWHPLVTLPAVAALVGLIVFVKLADKSFALVLVFAAALQVLVGTGVVNGLRG